MSNLIDSSERNPEALQDTQQGLASFSDADLLDCWLQDKQRSAFTQLVQRYSIMVLSVCRRGCRSTADADDAYQSTFLYLARNAGKIRHPERLAGWLHRVAHRAAMATLTAKKHETNEMAEPIDRLEDPLSHLTQRHEAMVLDEELAALPEHYRVAIVLHIMDGQSLERMAERLGTTIGTVRGQLQRGKQLLAQRLRRRGVVPVLAFAASIASTVSPTQAQAACGQFLQSMNAPQIPESPIDPSLLESLLHEGLRTMKAPLISGVVATAAILITLVTMTDSGIGGDNQSVRSSPQVAHLRAVGNDGNEAGPHFIAAQAGNLAANPSVDEGQSITGGGSSGQSERAEPVLRSWQAVVVAHQPTSETAMKWERALDQVFPVQQEKISLSDLPSLLSAQLSLPVELDTRAIKLAKLEATSEHVSIHQDALPLRSVLHQALQPLGLKAVVQDEGLMITADSLAQVRAGINAARWVNLDEDTEKLIAEALNKPTSIKVIETPLSDVVATLSDQHKIPIQIDLQSLESEGLSGDSPITLAREDLKLRSVLADVADEIGVTFTIHNESLMFVSRDKAENSPLVRVYWLEGTGYPATGARNVIELIQTSINSETWDLMGGQSTISPIENGIRPGMVVTTDYRTHCQIETLLARLRDAHFGPEPAIGNVESPIQAPSPTSQGGMF